MSGVFELDRRTVLTGVTGAMLFLPGCEIGEDIDDDEDDGTADVPESAIDATPNEVIVRETDLETGWRVTEIQGGQGTYLHAGNSLTMTVDIQDHDDVQSALEDYQAREAARLEEGYAIDDVEHGNEGYFLLIGDVSGKIVFLAGNFVIEIQALVYEEGVDVDLHAQTETFAEIIAENIAAQ